MKRSEQNAMWKRIAWWLAGLLVGLLAICGLLGALVIYEVIRPEAGEVIAQVLALASVFGVCWMVARSAPRQRLLLSGLIAAAAALVGLVCRMFFFADQPLRIGGLLLVFGVAAAAGVLASGKKSRKY